MLRASRCRTYSASATGPSFARRMIAQRFQNQTQVANRHALAQQQVQDLLHFGQFHHAGNQLVDDGRRDGSSTRRSGAGWHRG